MVRVAKQTDPEKIKELQQKINDRLYLEMAINRIASSLTDGILNMIEVKGESK